MPMGKYTRILLTISSKSNLIRCTRSKIFNSVGCFSSGCIPQTRSISTLLPCYLMHEGTVLKTLVTVGPHQGDTCIRRDGCE